MSVLAKLMQAAGPLMRWLGLSKAELSTEPLVVPTPGEPVTSTIIETSTGVAPPAVAVFIMRTEADRFLLAARLASVAKLNTPSGRAPFSAQRPKADHPPVPASRVGAKKVRLDANRGRRIELSRTQTQRPSNVIPFPRPGGVAQASLAKAA